MPVKIRCPDCETSWVLDGPDAGAEFACPMCMRLIRLTDRPTLGAAPTVEPPRAPEKAVGRPAVDVAAGAGLHVGDEVVCPRCNLHFYPRGRKNPSSDEKRHTILIVEDQEYFRQIAADALDPTYQVKTAEGTDEAREILTRGGIDLLVLDLTLGGGDDGEKLLRSLVPKPCPILIFTAQDESELYGERWEELSRMGADDLVMKGMQVGESLNKKARLLLGDPPEEDVSA